MLGFLAILKHFEPHRDRFAPQELFVTELRKFLAEVLPTILSHPMRGTDYGDTQSRRSLVKKYLLGKLSIAVPTLANILYRCG